MKNKRLIGILTAIVVLLLIPFVAMQFTTEVDWDVRDFTIAAVLLLGTGLTAEAVMRNVKNKNVQYGLIALILMLLFLIWAELAVGIFGTPFAGS